MASVEGIRRVSKRSTFSASARGAAVKKAKFSSKSYKRSSAQKKKPTKVLAPEGKKKPHSPVPEEEEETPGNDEFDPKVAYAQYDPSPTNSTVARDAAQKAVVGTLKRRASNRVLRKVMAEYQQAYHEARMERVREQQVEQGWTSM
ncbi:hypothetical protein TruAng_008248 [Truncatella angustata]|nr:hypothetical protein TruAng_008248 [Truncatella angustata]